MCLRTPRSKLTHTLFPYTSLFRSRTGDARARSRGGRLHGRHRPRPSVRGSSRRRLRAGRLERPGGARAGRHRARAPQGAPRAAGATAAVIERDVPLRALAVFAHPDDPEVSCGGTLARWTRGGSEVHLVIANRGDKGSSDPATEDRKSTRLNSSH